jgi:hypothetical protein
MKNSIVGQAVESKGLAKVNEELVSLRNQVNTAYDERNHIALLTALVVNDTCERAGVDHLCGWYNDPNGEEGFKRVISINRGRYTFHVPDSFNLGRLPITKPDWDGHSTQEKYKRMQEFAARHTND